LQGHAVDNSGQHAHVVAVGAFDAGVGLVHASVNISSSDHDGYLNPEVGNGLYVAGVLSDHVGIETEGLVAHQGFTGKFE